MWHDLFVAVALMLVIEGIIPFLNPDIMRRTLLQMAQLDNRQLRAMGLACMVSGVILLYVIR